jgi:hypothetical protein
MTMESSVAGETVIVAVPVRPPKAALISVLPASFAVTKPEETAAIGSLLLFQTAVLVTSTLEPSA